MKYVVVLCDGMADYPVPALGGKTPMMVAKKPHIDALAAQAEKSVDIDGLLALAASAPALDAAAPALPPPVEGRPRIAVARDKAFCFYYADGLELLETLGAELAEFSPLADESLPEGACGLYLGGGYPELFAGALCLLYTSPSPRDRG